MAIVPFRFRNRTIALAAKMHMSTKCENGVRKDQDCECCRCGANTIFNIIHAFIWIPYSYSCSLIGIRWYLNRFICYSICVPIFYIWFHLASLFSPSLSSVAIHPKGSNHWRELKLHTHTHKHFSCRQMWIRHIYNILTHTYLWYSGSAQIAAYIVVFRWFYYYFYSFMYIKRQPGAAQIIRIRQTLVAAVTKHQIINPQVLSHDVTSCFNAS